MADLKSRGRGRGRSRLSRVTLIVSLALNLAVAGLVAGAALSGRWDGGPRGFGFAIGPMAAALAPDDRTAIRERLRQQGGNHHPTADSERARMATVLEALRAEPYDPAILDEFFSNIRQRTTAQQQEAQDALVLQVHAMSAADREAFAMRLEEELSRMPHRR